MGGKALSVKGVRMDKNTYDTIAATVLQAIGEVAPGVKADIIPAIFSKTDFGDIDVLLEAVTQARVEEIAQALQVQEVVRNGTVVSLGLPQGKALVQVDLIQVPAADYEFAKNYFGFNDLGNLLGRVAHKAGFKMGHLGLRYVLRDDEDSSHVLQELVVTRDWDAALELLGYEAARYRAGQRGGFQTLEDLFKYVISSPYAYKDMYLLENMSHAARTRDRKRPTYKAFLQWLERDELAMPEAWENVELVRTTLLQTALERFPDFREAYAQAVALNDLRKTARAKFNGKLVAEITGTTGLELGEVMRRIRSDFGGRAEFWQWVVDTDTEEIRQKVLESNQVSGVVI